MAQRERTRSLARPGIALALALGALLASANGAWAATISVNSTADAVADDGECVLREAIAAANDDVASGTAAGECAAGDAPPAVDTIEFSIAGAAPHTITPATALAPVTAPVRIDGSTAAGDEIRVDGGATAGVTHGLRFQAGADGSVVTAMTVTGFDGSPGANGIYVESADAIVIEDSYVGTNRSGTAGLDNHVGIEMRGAGGAIRDSWVSGNVLTGIDLAGSGHALEGNRIGLRPGAPATALANGGSGVSVEGPGR